MTPQLPQQHRAQAHDDDRLSGKAQAFSVFSFNVKVIVCSPFSPSSTFFYILHNPAPRWDKVIQTASFFQTACRSWFTRPLVLMIIKLPWRHEYLSFIPLCGGRAHQSLACLVEGFSAVLSGLVLWPENITFFDWCIDSPKLGNHPLDSVTFKKKKKKNQQQRLGAELTKLRFEMFPLSKEGVTAQIKGRHVVLINVFKSLIPLFTSAERLREPAAPWGTVTL